MTDGVGRLTRAVGSGHDFQYGYAASGGCGVNTAAGNNSNRTSLTDNGSTVGSYCYDNTDRLTSATRSATVVRRIVQRWPSKSVSTGPRQ